jgi:class 3 adenylate cyclase
VAAADLGVVNKFEGDAVLCVFGAPADHPDPSGAGLRAARRVAAAVRAAGELDLGVGVACGQGVGRSVPSTLVRDAEAELSAGEIAVGHGAGTRTTPAARGGATP